MSNFFDERGFVMASKVIPGAKRIWIFNAIQEKFAIEMIAFVLIGSGCDATDDSVDGVSVAVERLNAQFCESRHAPAKIGDR